VHWKKSATAGKLLKVEREREDRQQYTLRIPSDAPETRSSAPARRPPRSPTGCWPRATTWAWRPAAGGSAPRRGPATRSASSRRSPPWLRDARARGGAVNLPQRRALRLRLRDLAAGSAFSAVALSGALPTLVTALFGVSFG